MSELILQEIHKEVGHSGCKWMWVLSKCIVRDYIVLEGWNRWKTCHTILLPDEPSFTRTGVNYLDPFEVKCGRAAVIIYIGTCLAFQAVHLEMAAFLDTDSLINALHRFIAWSGQVMQLRSDNGTNFVGRAQEGYPRVGLLQNRGTEALNGCSVS